MRTIQPSDDSIQASASKDRSDVSDLYLQTTDLVKANDDARSRRGITGEPSPLNMQPVFDHRRAMWLVALMVFLAGGLQSLAIMYWSLNIGDKILTGATFGSLVGVASVFLLAIIITMYRLFCKVADINVYFPLIFIVPVMGMYATTLLWLPWIYVGLLGIIVGLFTYVTLLVIYRKAHKRRSE